MNTSEPPFLEFLKQANGTLPEAIGEADLSTLNTALAFLFGRLRQARADFEQVGDDGRWGAFCALGAFRSFIMLFRTPLKGALDVPIARLQEALRGVEFNRRDPILKPPVRRPGRAPPSYAYAHLKGHAAATVERLRQAGLRRVEAHRAVARKLSQLGVRPERGSGTVTATTVRNWWNEVSSDVARRGPAAVMYDDVLSSEEEKKFSALPKDRARQLALRNLANWVRSVFPELQKTT
jgi:hypothetical protein